MFAALLAPTALLLLNTTFTEPRERAKAFGIFSAISGAGGGAGLLFGGVLTEKHSYSATYWTAATNDQRQVDWRFTTRDARIKLRHLYPAL